ncbi:hypothetical protein N7510_003828 [Penicillium lagena]|uniref:uncharacterized protein n=1 Tax=Penicillium lagena TaxID=94218 RepID=UPI00254214BB|nr:uncharacterized protein N7510_003828 [Penicillium lagena]KAJ5619844.1 hypothetical protein N7510_003828 [Penicillium lagena]
MDKPKFPGPGTWWQSAISCVSEPEVLPLRISPSFGRLFRHPGWIVKPFSTHSVLPPTSTVMIFRAALRVAPLAEGLSWTFKLKAVPPVVLDAG